MIRYKVSTNIYRLPFVAEIDIRPAPYHFEEIWQRNAVDFALDIDKPVLAVEYGIVFKVVDGHGIDESNEKGSGLCNLIMIEHQHGEYSCYAHLKKGILVDGGHQVKAGQVIGYSGLSGYTTYPHLHFQAMVRDRNGGWGGWMTIRTRFRVDGQVKILVSPKE